jgi:Adenylate and Guanylate cyclase catalytic domain
LVELPGGTVTLVFTDIESSTRLLHELGERYVDVLTEHRRILRDAFARHGGVEVDTQGDAFFVAFARAADAVAAARDAQAASAPAPCVFASGFTPASRSSPARVTLESTSIAPPASWALRTVDRFCSRRRQGGCSTQRYVCATWASTASRI